MNTNHTLIRSWRRLPAILVLVLGGLFAGQAQALIGGSITCTMAGFPTYGYPVEPGAEIRIVLEGTCKAIRVFPTGAAVNHELYSTWGSGLTLRLADAYYNRYVFESPLGTDSRSCFNPWCSRVPAGGSFTYTFYLSGRAPTTPGFHRFQLNLGYTSISYPNYAEWILQTEIAVRVVDNTCTLKSPSSVNLSFGSISSANLDNEKQSTSVMVDCPSAKSANVSLMPTQGIVDASTGIARTTLSGLNMQASWSDTSSPVSLGNARAMQLRSGSNALNLTFKPKLASTQVPVGAFQSQYTLVINYL